MEIILSLIWIFSIFIWAVYDINLRIDKNEINWYYIFVFIFNILFMPLLAVLEKIYQTDDYMNALGEIWKKIKG